jgi:hypothetical protein
LGSSTFSVQVLGTTATQGIIAYTAPDANPCTVQVSENSSLSPLVPDIDPTIFANSDLDNRVGSISNGTAREFVIGQRAAQLATAGLYAGIRHYSRALQAYTTHYGQVTCDSQTTTFSFTTTNIPLGNTYPDPWLNDPSNPGTQPFPEALGDGSSSFIDPLTGMLLKEVSLRDAQDHIMTYPPNNPIITAHNAGQVPCDSAGPWNNPCYAVAAQGYGGNNPANFASVGNSTSWLILPVDMNQGVDGGLYRGTSYQPYGVSLNQIAVTLTGYVTSPTSNLDQIDVCLSMNGGASCANQIQTIQLQTSSSTQTAGEVDTTKFGIIPWVLDSSPRINRPEVQAHEGTVSVSGNTLTWESGDVFSTYWFTGGNSVISLAASSQSDACNYSSYLPSTKATQYALTSLVDGNHMTVSGTPPSGTYYYCAHNFAVMVRRHQADASSTAYIQAAYLSTNDYLNPQSTFDDGGPTTCFNTLINGGFLCYYGGLFWVNPATGATSWLGSLSDQGKKSGANQWIGWGNPCSSNEGLIWDNSQTVPTGYCFARETSGKLALLKVTYTGPTTPPTQPQGVNSQMENLALTNTDDYSLYYGGGELTFTDVTPGSINETIFDQLAAFDPTFNPSLFTNCVPTGTVSNGIVASDCISQGQDSPGWFFAIAVGDSNPLHAGTSSGAHVIGAVNSYDGTLVRWRGIHGFSGTGDNSNYFRITTNGYGTMINSTHDAITATGTDCSAYGGTTGQQCSLIQMDLYQSSYEPYLQSPTSPFVGTPGELGNAASGDRAAVGSKNGEIMTLVAKNYGGVAGQWVWQRSASLAAITGAGQKTFYFQPSLQGAPYWDPSTDPHGLNMFIDTETVGGHGYARDGSESESYNTGSLLCSNQSFFAYQNRLGYYPALATAPMTYVNANPTFGGSCYGLGLPNDVQSHPNPGGALAAASGNMQGFDARPLVAESIALPFNLVSGQLYLSTWDGTDPDNLKALNGYGLSFYLNRKLVSTAATAGSHPLIDISGPGSTISDQANDSYEYCVVRVAGECRSGSSAGQVYVNAPNVVTPSCVGNGVHGGANEGMGNDICIFNGSSPAQMIVQYGLTANDPTASSMRDLTTAIGGVRMTSGFANARLLPDSSWIFFEADYLDLTGMDIWMGKMPPYPSQDSYDRSTFIPVTLNATPPSGEGITNAIVQFGYQEYNGNCTTRNDPCIANQSSVSSTDPFYYSSENPSGMPCSSGCTIVVPGLPQHVLYYQIQYRNNSNQIVQTVSQQATITDDASDLGGSSTAKPTINAFSASPSSVSSGGTSTLSWNVSNASLITISPGSVSTTTLAGSINVNPSSTTDYTLTASNSNGASTAQTWVTVTVTTSTSSPPQSLSAASGNAQVSLSWSAPASNGGSSLTQYLIYDRTTGSPSFSFYGTTTPSQTSLTVTSLTNGQGYNFEVVAQNGVGTSSPSNIVTATPFTVPNAPTSPSATAGNAQATVSFTPGSNGGSAILYYTATSNPNGIHASSTTSSVIVLGLTNGTSYTFTVTARNAAGTSASSSPSNSVTPDNLHPAISSFSASPTSVSSGGTSTLSWSTALASTVSIDQGLGNQTATSSGFVIISPASTTVYTLTAANSNGNSTAQAIVTIVTVDGAPPSVPQNLSATAISQNEIDLSWTASTDNVGVVGYDIYRNSTNIATTNLTAYNDTSLSAGTSYSYTVDAYDAAGNVSGQSSSTSATTQSGGGGGGGGNYIPPTNIPPATTTPDYKGPNLQVPNQSVYSSSVNLINSSGTFYLIINGQRDGITDPGILNSYGFNFNQSQIPTAAELNLPLGPNLPPDNGSLVKTLSDPTIYLISGGQRHGLTSSAVFTGLGFKTSNVLTVTSPELDQEPIGSVISNSSSQHLPGVDINKSGTIYWIGTDNQLHTYPDIATYNSWHIANNFSGVVPANAADLLLPVGSVDGARVIS